MDESMLLELCANRPALTTVPVWAVNLKMGRNAKG